MSKTENKTDITQDIIVIMDKSGSMASMEGEPLQALNSFILEQQKVLEGGESTFSLWTFDTTAELVIDDVPLNEVSPVTNYVPDGMTAMNDAIGKAINTKYAKHKSDNVICMVITDGRENSSREFHRDQIRTLIARAETKKNWKFIFIGAENIFSEGEETGFAAKRCVAYAPECPGMLLTLSREVSCNVARYRSVTASGTQIDLNITPPDPQLRQQTAPAAMMANRHPSPPTPTLLPPPPPTLLPPLPPVLPGPPTLKRC
jgi:hypothetical protein